MPLSVTAIDQLVDSVGFGSAALTAVEELNAEGRQFGDFDQLAEATRDLLKSKKKQEQPMMSPIRTNRRRKITDPGATSARSILLAFVRSDECQLGSLFARASQAELNSILQVADDVEVIIKLLKLLQNQGIAGRLDGISDIPSLVELLLETKQKSEGAFHASPEDQMALVHYLIDEECLLFSISSERVETTSKDLDGLLEVVYNNRLRYDSNASANDLAEEAILALRELDSKSARFSSFGELIPVFADLIRSRASDKTRLGANSSSMLSNQALSLSATLPTGDSGVADRTTILRFLSGEQCKLLTDFRDLHIKSEHLGRLILRSDMPLTLFILNFLNDQGRKYASLPQLVLAVRAFGVQARKHKAKLYQYLSSPTCRILHSGVTLSMDDVHTLYVDSKCGPDTMDTLFTFEARKQRFPNIFPSLLQALRQAHDHRVQARRQAQEEEAHRAENPVNNEQRQSIVDALTDSECGLLPYPARVLVNAADIDELIIAGRGFHRTKVHIVFLNRAGKVFDSIDALAKGIQEATEQAEEEVRELMFRLNELDCNLFIRSISIGPEDVDKLYYEGEAGPFTGSCLDILEREGQQMENIQELILNVKKTYMDQQTRELKEREYNSAAQVQSRRATVSSFLASPECYLLDSSVVANDLTPSNIDRMIEEGSERDVDHLMLHLQYLNDRGKRFGSFPELLQKAREYKDNAPTVQEQLLRFLQRPQCTLWVQRWKEASEVVGINLKRNKIVLNMKVMRKLYYEGAGPRTLNFLEEFENNHQRMSSVEELISTARTTMNTHREVMMVQKHLFQVYLLSPCCDLLYEGAPIDLIRDQDIVDLCDVCLSGLACFQYLQNLELAGRRFETLESVIRAIEKEHKNHFGMITAIKTYLASDECGLLKATVKASLNTSHAAAIFEIAGYEAVIFLTSFDHNGIRFQSVDDMLASLRKVRSTTISKDQFQRLALLSRLVHPLCTVVSKDIKFSEKDLQKLIAVTGSLCRTIGYLLELEQQRADVITSNSELLKEITTVMEVDGRCRHKILTGLKSQSHIEEEDQGHEEIYRRLHKLLRKTPLEDHSLMTLADIEPMFDLVPAANAGGVSSSQILLVLEHYEGSGVGHEFLRDLIARTRRTHFELVIKHKVAKRMVRVRLCCDQAMALLDDQVDIQDHLIGRLIAICGSGPATMYILDKLQADVRPKRDGPWTSTKSFLQAVRDFAQNRSGWKQETIRYLQRFSGARSLFSDEGISIDATDVDSLWEASRTENEIQIHIWTLTLFRKQYASKEQFKTAVVASRVACAADRSKSERLSLFAHLHGPVIKGLFEGNVLLQEHQVERLIDSVVNDAVSLLALIKEFVREGRKVPDYSQLVTVTRHEYKQLQLSKNQLWSYLRQPSRTLFRADATITKRDLDRLWETSQAGPKVLSLVEELQQDIAQGKISSFQHFGEFTRAVRNLYLQSKQIQQQAQLQRKMSVINDLPSASDGAIFDTPAEGFAETESLRRRDEVLAFLSEKKRIFFSDAPKIPKITQVDVSEIVEAGGSPSNTVMHLEYLESSGAKFDSYSAIVQAIKRNQHVLLGRRQLVLDWINSSECRLFKLKPLFTMTDIDLLFAVGKASLYTLAHIRNLNKSGRDYSRIVELAFDVMRIHNDAIHAIKHAKTDILSYLSNDERGIFSETIEISDDDLDELLSQGLSRASFDAKETLQLLQSLEDEGLKFASSQDLITSIKALVEERRIAALNARLAREKALMEKIQIVEFLESSNCHFFANDARAPVIGDEDIDKMYELSGSDTLFYVKLLEQGKQKKFYHFREVVDSYRTFLKEFWPDLFSSLEKQAEAFKDFVFGPSSDLWAPDSAVYKDSIDIPVLAGLLASTTGYQGAVAHCRSLQQQGHVFDSFDAFVDMLEKEAALGIERLQTVSGFLKQNTSTLFWPNQLDNFIPLEHVSKLFEGGVAPVGSLEILQNLAWYRAEKFESVYSLVPVLRKSCTQLYKAFQSLSKMILVFLNNRYAFNLFNEHVPAVSKPEAAQFAANGGISCISQLLGLHKEGKKFNSVSELLEAIKPVMTTEQTRKINTQMVMSLNDPTSGLFTSNNLTSDDVARLYRKAGVGFELPIWFWYLNHTSKKFTSIDSLANKVKELNAEALQSPQKVEEFVLLSFMSATANTLFSQELGACFDNDGVLGELIASCYGGVSTFYQILRFHADGDQFDSLQELTRLARQVATKQGMNKLLLFEFFKKKGSNLLKTSARLDQLEVSFLLESSGAGPNTLEAARKLAHSGKTFRTYDSLNSALFSGVSGILEDGDHGHTEDASTSPSLSPCGSGRKRALLTDGVASLAEATMNSSQAELKSFLSSPTSGLFVQPIVISIEGVFDLTEKTSEPAENLLEHARKLANAGRKFHGVAELVSAIKSAKERGSYVSMDDQAAIMNYISSEECKLLTGRDGSTPISTHEVDKIFYAAEELDVCIDTLKSLDSRRKRFSSIGKLAEALMSASKAIRKLSPDSDKALREYLDSPSTLLFSDVKGGVTASDFDLRNLILEAGGPEDALLALKKFSHAHRRFGSFDELLAAVEQSEESTLYSSEQDRQAIIDAVAKSNIFGDSKDAPKVILIICSLFPH